MNTFGLTVQDVIDVLSELSKEDRTKYVIGPDNKPFNTVEKCWIPEKWAGNVVRLSFKEQLASEFYGQNDEFISG